MITVALALCMLAALPGPEPIHALIITGENNHNWQYTSRFHKETLESSGRFTVDITDDPGKTLENQASLARYTLFVLDYNNNKGTQWSDTAKANFAAAVKGGTGVAVIHAADNAFKDWKEYEEIVGLLWRDGTRHGKFHPFTVKFTDPSHPITKGLPDMAAHPDELYEKLVNSRNSSFTVLGTAHADKEFDGGGGDEPMVLTLQYGKGRVFHTPLGHVWVNTPDSKVSLADPQLKVLLARGCEWAATGVVTLPAAWKDVSVHNTLSEQESKDGWKLLFDGKSAANFHGYKQATFPEKGWAVENGELHHVKGAGGGDIATNDDYSDFEFACDWKIGEGGNSGIMYRVTEDHGAPYETGVEMQVLDNARHADGKNPATSAGAAYALYACAYDTARPPGEWNHARIVCKGTRVEHWLNGFKVVEYDTASAEFKKLIEESKFKTMPDFAKRAAGKIDLQDHGDDVWYRDIKVRVLK